MITKKAKNSLIYTMLKKDQQKEFFEMKRQKFIPNIDTFYYSILLEHSDENLSNYEILIEYLKTKKDTLNGDPIPLSEIDSKLFMNGYQFGMYEYEFELDEECNYFFTKKLWNEETPHIVVQIRSYALWLYGVEKAYERTLKIVQDFLDKFNLKIKWIKENRIDYCWHTNFIDSPKQFFDINNIRAQHVGRLKQADFHVEFQGDYDYEIDYMRFGRLKSNRILFRAYLKSKEVVEMGYKPWFFKIWLMHGLINRFDFYCLEEAFKQSKWSYLNKARLQFFLDHAPDIDVHLKNRVERVLIHSLDHDEIKDLADSLTPPVTNVINFEFETKRKFYQSIEKVNFKNRTGFDKDVRIALDSLRLYADYLTFDSLRLVDPTTATRKKNCDMTYFWERLRAAQLDSPVLPKDVEMIRSYNDNVDVERIKERALRSAVMYNLKNNRYNGNIVEDNFNLISDLNDNDIMNYQRYANKKIHQLKIDESKMRKSVRNHVTIDLNDNSIISKTDSNVNMNSLMQSFKDFYEDWHSN
jgi:hypothetical protein